MAQEALLSLALPNNRALRPSISRRFTSLPSVAPTTFALELTSSTTSGSGLFHEEIGKMLRIPVGTVKSRMNKAVKMLLDQLREEGP